MKLTQKQKVLRHLKEIGSITPIDALRDYSIMRLTSRVCELKDEGHNIKSELVSGKNKYGESVRYSKYTLVEQE
jgi:hypothetical protein